MYGRPCRRVGCTIAERAPTGNGTIEPRWESEAGPGGHKARPYGKAGSGSVGADFISARAHRRVGRAPAQRTQKSLPLVTKGRWQAGGLTEGIRTGNDR